MQFTPFVIASVLPFTGIVDWDPRGIDPLSMVSQDIIHVSVTRMDTTPRSGEYLDPITSLVYEYDAAAQTLTPTGEAGSLILYAQIDVYPRGEKPSIDTPSRTINPDTMVCEYDFCISVAVVVTGRHTVYVEANVVPNRCAPARAELSPPPAPARDVTFYDARYGLNLCAPGEVAVRLFIDGVPVDSDTSVY